MACPPPKPAGFQKVMRAFQKIDFAVMHNTEGKVRRAYLNIINLSQAL
jgi:hypothetical protein